MPDENKTKLDTVMKGLDPNLEAFRLEVKRLAAERGVAFCLAATSGMSAIHHAEFAAPWNYIESRGGAFGIRMERPDGVPMEEWAQKLKVSVAVVFSMADIMRGTLEHLETAERTIGNLFGGVTCVTEQHKFEEGK